MLYSKLVCAVAFSVGALANPEPNPQRGGRGGGGGGGGGGAAAATTAAAAATALTLDPAAVQTGSASNGIAGGAEPGQSASQTSNDNFINFCVGKTLTNGRQVAGGSCNGIVMGDIPAKTNMVSSIILNPQSGDQIKPDTTFSITVQVANLNAGSFTNPDSTYYAAPQVVQNGNIVGHTHVTVQDLGKTLNPKSAPDPTQFVFFKGINDAGNGQGTLSAVVTGGLPAGNYRVCTMASASNHQPVLMPVAQRGSPDDCTKFTVADGGTAGNGAKGQAAAAPASEAATSESTATATAGAGADAGGKKRKGVKGAKNGGAAASATETAAATDTAANAATDAATDAATSAATDTATSAATDAATATTDTATATSTGTASGKGRGGRRGGQRGRKLKFAKRKFIA